MKTFTIKEAAPILLIFIMAVMAYGFYNSPCLPDRVPSHWNAAGEIDGYSSKNFLVFFYPAMALGVYLLMLFLPKIDPFRKNYAKFARPYYFIRLFLLLFFLGLYMFNIVAAYGYNLNIKYFIIPLMSLLFLGLGFVMPKLQRNFFVGIRTPWTLQSDLVWQKTHKMAGSAFILMAVLSFLTMFLGQNSFWVFIILVLIFSFLPMVYSYYLYRKLNLFNK